MLLYAIGLFWPNGQNERFWPPMAARTEVPEPL